MLTKRTQVLVSEELWKSALEFAKKQKMTYGEFVRKAITDTLSQNQRLLDIRSALADIRRVRTFSKKKIDYKKLIEYGRRY